MIKKIFATFLLTLLLNATFAHSGKPKFHVVIDTDGAIDDMRAISMLLAQNDIRVLAITCSQGTLLSDSVGQKVEALLSAFHHEGIPVGIGDDINEKLPVWASFAQNIEWGNPTFRSSNIKRINSGKLLDRIFENYPEKITLVALGSLKTYADWLKQNPQNDNKIDRIVWYNNFKTNDDFNYSVSPESLSFIESLKIRLDRVGNVSNTFLVDEQYLSVIANTNSPYAKQIEEVHKSPEIVARIKQKHLVLWDDIIPLYLTVPILFESTKNENTREVELNSNLPVAVIDDAISKLLESGTTTNNRVFNSFPTEQELYKPAYSNILKETIGKFGPIEWKAICLTNEIHGHTGIYSIVGAKMGIRAMEYFNVGVNNLTIKTFAGHEPPLSCFNDGIQISSGATIGQGLITVSDTVLHIPTAQVEFNRQKILISLKPEIATQMQKDIKYGVKTYGLESETYWLYIEELALRYWAEYDRNEIFAIKCLDEN